MIPIRDVIPSRTTPWFTVSIIAAILAIFAYQHVLLEDGFMGATWSRGFVPARASASSAVVSLFLHDGLFDLLVNAWAVWMVGGSLEDRIGHVRFGLLFAIGGLTGCVAAFIASPGAATPLVGPGAAIAALMAAYFSLFPRSRVLVVVPARTQLDAVEIPALLVPAAWITTQLLGGMGQPPDAEGVRGLFMWPYVGGAVAGALALQLFRRPAREAVAWWSP